MHTEAFFTGYCRQQDGPRMVEATLLDGVLEEADCNFAACPYRGNCTIGQELTALSREEELK